MFYPLRGAKKRISSWTNIMNDVSHLWLCQLCSWKKLLLDLKISCSLELFINAPNVHVKFFWKKYSSRLWICLILHTRVVLAFLRWYLHVFQFKEKYLLHYHYYYYHHHYDYYYYYWKCWKEFCRPISTPIKIHLLCSISSFS